MARRARLRAEISSDRSSEPRVRESDPLGAYLKQISSYPLLNRADESEVARQISLAREKLDRIERKCRAGSEARCLEKKRAFSRELNALRSRMVTSNLRLVVSIAKRYQNRGLSLLDLINEGNLGLLEAVDRFDYRRGCKFSTYGTWWIQQAVTKALAEKVRTIRVPIHVLNAISKYHAVSLMLSQELGRDPTHDEIATFVDAPEGRVRSYLTYALDTSSLDVPIDSDHSTSVLDLQPGSEATEPVSDVFRENVGEILDRSLSELDEREIRVLRLRFGLAGEAPLTLQEIGSLMRITRERVRQVQNTAIRKLRACTRIQELHAYL